MVAPAWGGSALLVSGTSQPSPEVPAISSTWHHPSPGSPSAGNASPAHYTFKAIRA